MNNFPLFLIVIAFIAGLVVRHLAPSKWFEDRPWNHQQQSKCDCDFHDYDIDHDVCWKCGKIQAK